MSTNQASDTTPTAAAGTPATTSGAALVERVRSRFAADLGHAPAGVWGAPGRVNLIGEHTDYNDGFCMPFALPHRVVVAAAPRDDQRWRVTSLTTDATVEFGIDDLVPGMTGWQAYVAGIVWALREAGHTVPGVDLVLDSDVPSGAGLSSSAALECAVMTTLVDLGGLTVSGIDRAVLARRCENEFVGAPTGLMDQAASTLCTAGHALFFDCRTTEGRQVPFDPSAHGLELLVLDTNTPHALVDSEYAERRRSCERAAELLDVPALRDVTADDLDAALARLDDELLRRRVRHVVTEDDRVLQAMAALTNGDLVELGQLLDASHASMRDDFEITVPTVDCAVETARAAGAIGARMTGGGFGGCIIALVPTGSSDAVAGSVAAAFAERGYAPPAHFVTAPAPGAGRIA